MPRSSMGVWVCGCVGVWVCGCVGVWVTYGTRGGFLSPIHPHRSSPIYEGAEVIERRVEVRRHPVRSVACRARLARPTGPFGASQRGDGGTVLIDDELLTRLEAGDQFRQPLLHLVEAHRH